MKAPMKARLAVAWAALLCLVACGRPTTRAPSAVDPARVVDLVRNDEVHWNDDWKSGDAAKVASHFAQNGVLAIAGSPPMSGRAAIVAGVGKAMDDKAFSLGFASDAVLVARSGDLAVARGVYQVTATDPARQAPTSQTGAFITVYRPEADGAWRAIWEVATPAAPAVPASKAKASG